MEHQTSLEWWKYLLEECMSCSYFCHVADDARFHQFRLYHNNPSSSLLFLPSSFQQRLSHLFEKDSVKCYHRHQILPIFSMRNSFANRPASVFLANNNNRTNKISQLSQCVFFNYNIIIIYHFFSLAHEMCSVFSSENVLSKIFEAIDRWGRVYNWSVELKTLAKIHDFSCMLCLLSWCRPQTDTVSPARLVCTTFKQTQMELIFVDVREPPCLCLCAYGGCGSGCGVAYLHIWSSATPWPVRSNWTFKID